MDMIASLLEKLAAYRNGEGDDSLAATVFEDAATEVAASLGRSAKFVRVMSKATKTKSPERCEDQWAIVVPGKSVRLLGLRWGTGPAQLIDGHLRPGRSMKVPYDVVFDVGDAAEFHSYNKAYFSKITKITAECVFFGEEQVRLHLSRFSSKNRDPMAPKLQANHEWTD